MPRPKLSEQEKKERRREANKKYYETHKQSMQAKARARYHQSKRGDDHLDEEWFLMAQSGKRPDCPLSEKAKQDHAMFWDPHPRCLDNICWICDGYDKVKEMHELARVAALNGGSQYY